MSCINQALIKGLPAKHKEVLGFYPDLLVFQHNAEQYQTHWDELAGAKYLYTTGYVTRPASAWRYAFESFKGWLGFNNHCKKEKVQISLQKLAYYGYLKGYSGFLSDPTHYPLPESFLELIRNPRANDISKAIQTALTSYFVENASSIVPDNTFATISNSNSFGSTFARLGLWRQIPKIDPQNEGLTKRAFEELERQPTRGIHYRFLPNSQYAIFAALRYIAKAEFEKTNLLYNFPLLNACKPNAQLYLEKARAFHPDIINTHLTLYIDYFLEKSNYEEAFKLIQQLSDIELAGSYLVKNYTTAQHHTFVAKDSPLGKFLANHYLKQSSSLQNTRLALCFNSNIKIDAPDRYFSLLVEEKCYDEAYQLFADNNGVAFLAQDRRLLANHFDSISRTDYESACRNRELQEWQTAQFETLRCLEAKRKALALEPKPAREEHCKIHRRLYAQLLIDEETSGHSAAECEIEKIVKAVKILDECKTEAPSKKEEANLNKSLAKGLMRQVDYLVYKFSVPLLWSRDSATRIKHKGDHATNFELALDALKRVVHLLKNPKDAEEKQILGKAYYLIADISKFFDLGENHADYYKLAMDTVPKNPFYIYNYSLVAKNKEQLRERAQPLLKDLGYSMEECGWWYPDRWQQEGHSTTIKDIHSIEPSAPRSIMGFTF